jgi:Host cell surface-exposed lipoprotein
MQSVGEKDREGQAVPHVPALPPPPSSDLYRPRTRTKWVVAGTIAALTLSMGVAAVSFTRDTGTTTAKPAVVEDPVVVEDDVTRWGDEGAGPEYDGLPDVSVPPQPEDPSPNTTEPIEAEPAEPVIKDEPEIAEREFTVSQENAIETAESYLDYTGFSKSGLVGQLKYEKFSPADAWFAVNHIDVNWNEQAAKVAKDYLEYSSFSRQGLIDQLEYEGFTTAQAIYGVNRTGL